MRLIKSLRKLGWSVQINKKYATIRKFRIVQMEGTRKMNNNTQLFGNSESFNRVKAGE